jgi:hypothetical protein
MIYYIKNSKIKVAEFDAVRHIDPSVFDLILT